MIQTSRIKLLITALSMLSTIYVANGAKVFADECVADLGGECVMRSSCPSADDLGPTEDCLGPTFTCCDTEATSCVGDLGGECVQASDCSSTNDLGPTDDCLGPTFTCCTPPVDCEIDLGGACTTTSNCPGDSNLGPTPDCLGPTFTCCDLTTLDCETDLGGECVVTASCPSGASLGNTGDCLGPSLVCCDPTPEEDDDGVPPSEYVGADIEIPQLINLIFTIMMPFGIGLGVFFMIKAGYTIKLSEGNPDKKKQGVEELTSAVLGTLYISFALVILRIIIKAILGGDIGW